MRISSAFPSTYLKAADLQGRNVTVEIDRIDMEEIGGDHKPVMYFVGKEKGVVLNKTNANNITIIYGDDTDNWIGAKIVLFEATVDFQGRSVAAIRVRALPVVKKKDFPSSAHAEVDRSREKPRDVERSDPRQNASAREGDMDDDILF